MARQGDGTLRISGIPFENKYVTYDEAGVAAASFQISGSNAYGQHAQPGAGVSSPIIITSGTIWSDIYMSRNYRSTNRQCIYAKRNDGTLWSWGDNLFGRLGRGVPTTTTSESTPVQVGTSTEWRKIDLNSSTAWMLDNNGELYFCGDGGNTTGLGSTSDVSTPVQVGSGNGWVDVNVSMSTNSAATQIVTRKADNSWWVWGNSGSKLVGQGDTVINSSSPIQMTWADASWSELYLGVLHTILLKTDGTLWSSGIGTFGRLGLGDSLNVSTFVQIGSDTNWTSIAVQTSTNFAIKSDGTFWSWGADSYGNLGQGTFSTHLSSPTQIGSLTDWSEVWAGEDHAVAMKTDGTLWAWGAMISGSGGTGTSSNINSPLPVLSNIEWKDIVGGGSNTIFIS
jgi:hypothetical protein